MGVFDLFKRKEKPEAAKSAPAANAISLSDFDCYYLYGLTDDPFRQSKDFKAFGELYKNVIGSKGGIVIGSSFHPYQLVNPKGTTAWQAGYVQLYTNKQKDEAFNAITTENGLFMVDPSAAFKDLRVWPDTRLTFEENPIFSKYVPFVIPFLVYKPGNQINWNAQITLGMATKGNASGYVQQITELAGFLMPAPSFILGFDKFEEANPIALIDNFISCKQMLGV